MADRPIIFSGSMVRALLDGRKTQTRSLATSPLARAQLGDRLWVRESWQTGMTGDGPQIAYAATPDFVEIGAWDGPDEGRGPSFNYDRCPGAKWHDWLPDVLTDGPWRPSIHMPRWASRLTLVVTEVRHQHIQDISNEDCIAEGIPLHPNKHASRVGPTADDFDREHGLISHYGAAFLRLWDGLHAKPGERFRDNPAVVALTFAVHHANIDALDAAPRQDLRAGA